MCSYLVIRTSSGLTYHTKRLKITDICHRTIDMGVSPTKVCDEDTRLKIRTTFGRDEGRRPTKKKHFHLLSETTVSSSLIFSRQHTPPP